MEVKIIDIECDYCGIEKECILLDFKYVCKTCLKELSIILENDEFKDLANKINKECY